jgi:molecular chaperone DnaK
MYQATAQAEGAQPGGTEAPEGAAPQDDKVVDAEYKVVDEDKK